MRRAAGNSKGQGPRPAAVKNDLEAALPAEQGSGADTQPRRRTRILAVGAVALVAIAAALAVLLQSSGKPRAATGSALPAGDTTVTVQRRTLTEHAQVDGTLGYGGTLELYDRIAGTFTWLPGVGSVIERGGTLFKIDQLPIVLMYGSVPAYRTLKEGVSDGQDVAQLNENLVALGYDPYGEITDYEHFGEATAAAVRRWQQAEGLPQSGEVELGRVVFAPSARRVTAVKATLGQDPPSPNKGRNPSKSKNNPESSAAATAGTPALTTTSVQQLVQVDLEADKQQLARVGATAPVTLPSGQTVNARIASVGSVATESGGGESSGKATIPVTLVLDHHVPHLDAAPVTVELIKERRRGVLTIPATALIATAGGGYAVEALEGQRRVEVPVTPGMFADGYVQIEGEGVHEGMTVTEPAE